MGNIIHSSLFTLHLKVYFIVMTVSLFVEQHNPAVVQVVGRPHAFVLFDVVPPLPVAPDVLHDHHRPLVAPSQQLLHGLPVVADVHPRQLHGPQPSAPSPHATPLAPWRGVRGEAGVGGEAFTPRLPVLLVPVAFHGRRLSPVGQSHVEPSQLSGVPVVVLSQAFVGIVRPFLVDDISHEGIVLRRLDAESQAPMHPRQPYHPSPQHHLLLCRSDDYLLCHRCQFAALHHHADVNHQFPVLQSVVRLDGCRIAHTRSCGDALYSHVR